MALVAHRLLALTIWINVLENTSVYGAVKEVVNRIIVHRTIIGKNGNGDNGVNDCTVPVTVRLRIIVPDQWIINGHQHPVEGVDVLLLPTRVGVPEDLCSIAKNMAGPCGQQLRIVV